MLGWLFAACVTDPEVDAWHRTIEVTSVQLAEEDCDGELLDTEPIEPYLFLAIQRNVPDVASVYWCPEPGDCPVPSGSVYLNEFTVDHLAGNLASSVVGIGLCTVFWFDLVADKVEDEVSMTFRIGRVDATDLSPEACAEFAPAALGTECQSVFAIEGRQVDP